MGNEYFDIEYNPGTGKTTISISENTAVRLKQGLPLISLFQGQDKVILSKQTLLDLADYIRSQEG